MQNSANVAHEMGNMPKGVNFLLVLTCLTVNLGLCLGQTGWVAKSSMPTPRSGISAAVLDGQIYVIGGRDPSNKVLDVVERYNPDSDTWESGLPPLRSTRENAAAVVFDGQIFVLGGRSDEGEISKKVEFFDRTENEWKNVKGMERRREGLTAVVLGGELFAIGGFGGSDNQAERFLDSVERYDANEDRWHIAKDWHLEQARAAFATASVNDSAFSMGGFGPVPLKLVQRYHANAGATSRSTMLLARGGLAAAAANNLIVILGGRSASDQVQASVEVFDPEFNVWEPGLSLSTARENFVTATVGDKIYVIGGRGANDHVLSSVEAALTTDIVTSVFPGESIIPRTFHLNQNYPNPFNPETKISFQIPGPGFLSPTKLVVYNLQGQLIKTLVDEIMAPGEYELLWNGRTQTGKAAASGVYIYRLQSGKLVESRKMLLIR